MVYIRFINVKNGGMVFFLPCLVLSFPPVFLSQFGVFSSRLGVFLSLVFFLPWGGVFCFLLALASFLLALIQPKTCFVRQGGYHQFIFVPGLLSPLTV